MECLNIDEIDSVYLRISLIIDTISHNVKCILQATIHAYQIKSISTSIIQVQMSVVF